MLTQLETCMRFCQRLIWMSATKVTWSSVLCIDILSASMVLSMSASIPLLCQQLLSHIFRVTYQGLYSVGSFALWRVHTDIWVIEKGPGLKGPNKWAIHPTWLTVRAGLYMRAVMAGVYRDDSRPSSILLNDAQCMVPAKWLKDPDCRSNMCWHNCWGDQVTLHWEQGHKWGRGQFGELVLRCKKR